jgi:predicted naringenin-chalcone synthase
MTIEAIATGNPEYSRSQTDAAAFMARVESLPPDVRAAIPDLYERTAIGTRYSAVADFTRDDAEGFEFFPPNWLLDPAPSTAQRSALYREVAVPLAERVARDALARAGRDASEVTHVVYATCTGFFAPGPDIELVRRLGLPPTTRRVQVGFMGCYAAFNALRTARGFVALDPSAVVLVVCCELCTLHFRTTGGMPTAVVNALFADGCAAAVVSGRERAGTLELVDERALLDDDSLEMMTWDVGDTGFDMTLSPRVPVVLGRRLPQYLAGLLDPHGLNESDIGWWAIHPGGRAVVDKIQRMLNLSDVAVAESMGVLRDYGNMSSATILFVLRRFLDRVQAGERLGWGVAMAFGPGLTMEGALLRMRGA